jgi:WD40 repeat protein
MLSACLADNHLVVLRVATGEVMFRFPAVRPPRFNLDFSPDSTQLLFLSHDDKGGWIDVVDLRTGKRDRFTDIETSPLWAYFCTKGGLVAWLPTERKVVCWNVLDRTIRWETKPSEVFCGRGASMAPDRKSLLTAHDGDIALIDCETGKIRYRARCEQLVNTVAFLSDGRSFVVSGAQGHLSVWHAGTGQPLFELANTGTPLWAFQPLDRGFIATTNRLTNDRKEPLWYEF